MHRKSPRPLQIKVDRASPAQKTLPYLQQKAELEDDRTRRNELHDEHPVRELDDEGEILEIADEIDNTVSSLQERQGISEMPQAKGLSWEMPHQERAEVMGDEVAQELECRIQGGEDSVKVPNVQELEYQVQAREQPIRVGKAKDCAAPGHYSLADTNHPDPSQRHFTLRQQQITETSASAATD